MGRDGVMCFKVSPEFEIDKSFKGLLQQTEERDGSVVGMVCRSCFRFWDQSYVGCLEYLWKVPAGQ